MVDDALELQFVPRKMTTVDELGDQSRLHHRREETCKMRGRGTGSSNGGSDVALASFASGRSGDALHDLFRLRALVIIQVGLSDKGTRSSTT